jgi:hypothetical protein
MSFALWFVRSLKKVLFFLAYFQASAAPRPENSYLHEKDALFGVDTQITILNKALSLKMEKGRSTEKFYGTNSILIENIDNWCKM